MKPRDFGWFCILLGFSMLAMGLMLGGCAHNPLDNAGAAPRRGEPSVAKTVFDLILHPEQFN